MRTGDIIGFSDLSLLSSSIALGTGGVPGLSVSHVGVVASYAGGLYVFESRHAPHYCHLQREVVRGVTATPLLSRINEHFAACRWPGCWRWPVAKNFDTLAARLWLLEHLGTPYDYWQATATRIGLGGLLQRWLVGHENFDRLFCWELVAGALERGRLFPEHNASGLSPRRGTNWARRIGTHGRPEEIKRQGIQRWTRSDSLLRLRTA